jgi:hypothetical protein
MKIFMKKLMKKKALPRLLLFVLGLRPFSPILSGRHI